MKKKLVYGALSLSILLIAFGFSSYLISAKPTPKKDNLKHNVMYVKAEKINTQEFVSDMTYRGRVTAFDNVSLAAEVQGKIMQGDVRFKVGTNFKKNDVLINIYSEDVEAALKSGKSSFLQTISKILPDLRVDYPVEYEKWNTFFKAVDVEQPLPVLPEIASNKEKVFLAANNVLANYYTLRQQELNLSRYTIIAPFDGSFKTVNKEIGAIASPGAELANIIRTDKLEVTVPVFPSDLKWINKGNKIQIQDNMGDMHTATVARISQYVDEATQSVNVYLSYYSKSETGFLQGEYVDVTFNGSVVSGFELPREALVDNYYVYELKDKTLSKTRVEILRSLNDSYIISGLDTNKIIVTESLATINNNVEYLAR